jgi:hypothetical protein
MKLKGINLEKRCDLVPPQEKDCNKNYEISLRDTLVRQKEEEWERSTITSVINTIQMYVGVLL